MDMSNYR